jgi:prepilin-type N-terminal cleavage/methylation domain-containing protein
MYNLQFQKAARCKPEVRMKNLISQLESGKCQFRRWAAFTLVELMIVVAILGILAAIVLPEFQNQSQLAKESAAKANLKILRDAIERYALDHNGVAPGYPANNINAPVTEAAFYLSLVKNESYLSDKVKNPFNNKSTILMVANSATFPISSSNTSTYGWIYKPATKTIKLNWAGTDSEGKEYFSY